MNIFNRRNSIDDDLPGRERMPRPTLPPVEEQLGEMVRDQFAKPKARTPAVLAAELETNAVAFELAVNDAEAAAQAYCSTYAELQVEVDAKLESIEAQRKELRKLQASMPKVEKHDEQDQLIDRDPNLAGTGLSDHSKDPVQLKSIQGLNKPLPAR